MKNKTSIQILTCLFGVACYGFPNKKQAALPQGIVPFVFAKEYNVHPDILSTALANVSGDCGINAKALWGQKMQSRTPHSKFKGQKKSRSGADE
ncbi:hypothetical protein SCA6_003814 [Theobroma cacao]